MSIKNSLFSFGNGKPKFLVVSAITPTCIIPNATIDFFKMASLGNFDYIDIMEFIDTCSTLSEAVDKFQDWITQLSYKYDYLVGISFGGVILQKLLHILKQEKIILIASPNKMEGILKSKISYLADLLLENKTLKSVLELQKYVVQPSNFIKDQITSNTYSAEELQLIHQRCSKGYKMILDMQPSIFTQDNIKNIIAIIGEKSNLVTKYDITLPANNIYSINQSGMRVLEDSPEISKQIIKNFINDQGK